ncbi:hypothetical protein COY91_01200 [Candidatus Shapirobacteria bacterium CG_4_10_14_0_8_um_filter_39_15]|nr:MAG: hypothetical protein COY91_01200 [Candidatus Shapirobacteria bacterium CG_4_10_14_0_8_um_filter_39_15]PJE68244.1 MAG: hypothetical protein COU94_02860 [Candidatus Shapirobacteria bacterium CG10_big_fil_rev_8_21_14_0_10_38_8]
MNSNFQPANFKLKIPIFTGDNILVKVGEKVKPEQLLFSGDRQGPLVEINLDDKTLTSPLGSKVVKDQVIVKTKSFLGGGKEMKSPSDGFLESLTESGILKIRTKGEQENYRCPAEGKIEEISEAILIEFKGVKLEAADGWGKGNWGILKFQKDISVDDQGAILAVREKPDLVFCNKAEAIEAGGLICGKIAEGQGKDLSCLIMGSEEGIIPAEIWEELKKFEGQNVYLGGKEKILFIPK